MSFGLGDLVVGTGETDFESFDFSEPSFPFGFSEAVGEVVADLDPGGPLLVAGDSQEALGMRGAQAIGDVPADAGLSSP